jgi:hypothetical protein
MADTEPRMKWMPLRHWLYSYFSGLAAGLAAWLYTREFWFSAGAMVAVIVVYVFVLSIRLRPSGTRKTKPPPVTNRQARRAAARRADKEYKG